MTSPTRPKETSQSLVDALGEAVAASRIPVGEPAIFSGDPLDYNDWKLSFLTSVDRKNLPGPEKLCILRRFVSGPAKRSIEGLFLAGTEAAYRAAWTILDDRFGDPFVIGQCYRNTIYAWPKITQRDNAHLRQFVDFLSSVESTMHCFPGLLALNDSFEN